LAIGGRLYLKDGAAVKRKEAQIVHPTMIVFHEAVSARDVLRLITSRSQ
jgi:hypothetical protein